LRQLPTFFTTLAAALGLIALSGGCAGPTPRPTMSIDTQFLRDYAETRGFSSGRPLRIRLTPNGDAVLFLRSGRETWSAIFTK